MIIDAGIFLGSSTLSFASGLRAQNESFKIGKPIRSFERAITTPAMYRDANIKERYPTVGQDYSEYLRELLDEVLHLCDLRIGDIRNQTHDGQAIEILFLDILKTMPIFEHCNRLFMPYLIPGQSVVIQQDFFWHLDWFINAYMGYFKDNFEVLATAETSCAFLFKEGSQPLDGTSPFLEFSDDEIIALIDCSTAWTENDFQLAMVELCKLFYLLRANNHSRAEGQLHGLEERISKLKIRGDQKIRVNNALNRAKQEIEGKL